jgi:hypothetical protein
MDRCKSSKGEGKRLDSVAVGRLPIVLRIAKNKRPHEALDC